MNFKDAILNKNFKLKPTETRVKTADGKVYIEEWSYMFLHIDLLTFNFCFALSKDLQGDLFCYRISFSMKLYEYFDQNKDERIEVLLLFFETIHFLNTSGCA